MKYKNVSEDCQSIIPWHLYKGPTKGRAYLSSKKVFEDLILKLNDVNGTLLDYYFGDKIITSFKIDNVIINKTPSSFRHGTYKVIAKTIKTINSYNDEFVGFVGLNANKSLIARIKLEGKDIHDIDVNNLNSFYIGREKFRRFLNNQEKYTIVSVYKGFNNKIKCKCLKHNYFWDATPHNLSGGSGCPICARNVKKTNEQFVSELKLIDPNIYAIDEYKGADIKIKFKCVVDGHEWDATPSNILNGKCKCSLCKNRKRMQLQVEKELSKSKTSSNKTVRKTVMKKLDKQSVNMNTYLLSDFISELKKVNGTLESEYFGSKNIVTIKIDDALITLTPKQIISDLLNKIQDFKNSLMRGDKFVKFSRYTKQGLIAIINLENSSKLKEIAIKNYNSFCKSRNEFYSAIENSEYKLSNYFYSDKNDKITVHIDEVSFEVNANYFLTHMISGQAKFKEALNKNGDLLIGFVGKSGTSLIAKVLLEGREEHLINIAFYNVLCEARNDFYKFVKNMGAEVVDSVYKNSNTILNIKIDNAILSVTPTSFKAQISKSILNFKKKLISNNDKFICFSGQTKRGVLVARLELSGGEKKDIDMGNYDTFCSSRIEFTELMDDINGEIIGSYKGVEDIVKIKIDDVIIEQLASNIKNDTYHSIKRFKKMCIQHGDTFVKFTSLNNRNTLNAQIIPFDSVNNELLEINLNAYSNFSKARKLFYDSVHSVGGTVLGMYKGNFDCVDIKLDDLVLSTVIPDCFKLQIQKSIVNFKKQINRNGDKFVKFIGRTASSLIAKVLLEGSEESEVFINSYNNFCKGRKKFYKFKENNDRFTIYGVYRGSLTKMRAKCNLDDYEFDFLPGRVYDGMRCPRCSESKGEYKIAEWLDTHNIKYKKEKTFKDLRHKSLLRYDFYIRYHEYEICIEYDGEQHYKCVNFTGKFSDEQLRENLKDVQYKDMLKSKYCEDNGILLLRIPYWKYDEIDNLLKQFFNDIQIDITLCS